jgi:hypothetical protein
LSPDTGGHDLASALSKLESSLGEITATNSDHVNAEKIRGYLEHVHREQEPT